MGRFHHTADGTKFRIDLLPLSAYEADGGRYDDSGNGGEQCERSEFLCAMAAEEKVGDDWTPANALDAAQAVGVPKGGLWRDSVTGWNLLREWPAEAPLEARMVGQ